MIPKLPRWLFGSQPKQQGIPWWCMNPKHQPYYSMAKYDEHMLNVHKIDVRKGYHIKAKQ